MPGFEVHHPLCEIDMPQPQSGHGPVARASQDGEGDHRAIPSFDHGAGRHGLRHADELFDHRLRACRRHGRNPLIAIGQIEASGVDSAADGLPLGRPHAPSSRSSRCSRDSQSFRSSLSNHVEWRMKQPASSGPSGCRSDTLWVLPFFGLRRPVFPLSLLSSLFLAPAQ